MNYLTNAFSLNMVASGETHRITITPASLEAAQNAVRGGHFTSAVGHADTAAVLSDVLGTPVPCQRVTVALEQDDLLLVAQYRGPRLPEGATRLPEGASIEFVWVEIDPALSVLLARDFGEQECEECE